MATRTKAELLDALRENAQEVRDKLGSLPRERFEEGRYEGGWNGRQILAHAAAIEWTYPKLIEIAEGSDQAAPETREIRVTELDEAEHVPTRKAAGGINNYNERQVEKRANATVSELIEEFEANRTATIEAVQAAEEELFGREIRSAGGITGSLANVMYAVAVLHVKGHINDILGSE